MLRLFLARSLDRCRGNKDTPEGRLHTPQSDRKRAHRQRRGSLAEFRLPACRWGLSLSSPPIGRWFLDFLYLEPSHACAALHPSRRTAVPETRFPSPSSIECCPPFFEPRLEILPATGCLGPTVALPRRPPALALGDFCFDPSTVRAGLPQVDKWKRRVFEPTVDLDKERSAQPKSPIDHSEVSVPAPYPGSSWSSLAIGLAAPGLGNKRARTAQETKWRQRRETILYGIWIEELVAS
jgi:hypothetical protein